MAVVSIMAVLLVPHYPKMVMQLGAIPFTLVGIALSIFMNFRNSACYDRWWEGRKLWGQLLIETRSFARQLSGLNARQKAPLLHGLIAFSYSLGARLRGKDEAAAIPDGGHSMKSHGPNLTDSILRNVGEQCAVLLKSGAIDSIRYSVLELRLTGLSQVQAGCERIKATPLPFAYSLLLHRTAYLFCLLLPFALAHALGWWTPLLTLIVSYTFFGLDVLGDELEDPFGDDLNDLPLDSIIRTAHRELLFAAGEENLPLPLSPTNDVLT